MIVIWSEAKPDPRAFLLHGLSVSLQCHLEGNLWLPDFERSRETQVDGSGVLIHWSTWEKWKRERERRGTLLWELGGGGKLRVIGEIPWAEDMPPEPPGDLYLYQGEPIGIPVVWPRYDWSILADLLSRTR